MEALGTLTYRELNELYVEFTEDVWEGIDFAKKNGDVVARTEIFAMLSDVHNRIEAAQHQKGIDVFPVKKSEDVPFVVRNFVHAKMQECRNLIETMAKETPDNANAPEED